MTAAFSKRSFIQQMFFGLLICFILVGCVTTDTFLPEDHPLHPNNPPGSPNKEDYGKPYQVDFDQNIDGSFTFAIIADTHIDASYAGWVIFENYKYRDTSKVKRNRDCVEWANKLQAGAKKIGIDWEWRALIHLGDMVDAMTSNGGVQNLIAFRQIWEHSYPGHDGGAIAGASDDNDTAYSLGYKIHDVPLFPCLGNHDNPDKDSKLKFQGFDYVEDMIKGANGILSWYTRPDGQGGMGYIWSMGRYVCISLGLWAGSCIDTDSECVSYNKLQWLKEWLSDNIGDGKRFPKNTPIFVFQHYGWDSWTINDHWWSKEDYTKELNIFCRRDLFDDPQTVPGDPYNIVAIFTGHTHYQDYIQVNAGKDKEGNDIIFDNVVCDDSGSGDVYGLSEVHVFENRELTGGTLSITYWKRESSRWTPHMWEKQYHF